MTSKNVAPNQPEASAPAATYAEMGLAPIRIAKRDKRPLDAGWNTAPPDSAAVDRWVAHGGNIGLRMGSQPDGRVLVAIDEDEPGAIEAAEYDLGVLPPTLTSRTGSGGQHRIFEWPPGAPPPCNRVRAMAGIDIRSEGGQIVVAPSIHPNGELYIWEVVADVAPLPEAWVTALSNPQTAKRAAPSPTGAPGSRVDAIIGLVWAEYNAGPRHPLVRALSGWLARFELGRWSDAEIEALIRALPSDKRDDRVKVALETAARARSGEQTPGWEGLVERFGEERAKALELAARSDWWVRFLANRSARSNDNAEPEGDPPEPLDDTDPEPGRDPAVDYAIQALSNPVHGVFQRSGELIRITRDASIDRDSMVRPAGAPTIRTLPLARTKEILGQEIGGKEANRVAGLVHARGEWSCIPPLAGIVQAPFLAPDGSIVVADGYHAPTRTLASMGVQVEVPESPTLEDAQAAVTELEDLVCDFPFASPADRAAWIAGVLTVPARPAIDGPTPMFLFDASDRGSGKTLLADLIAIIATGEAAPRRTAPKEEDEWRKALFALLSAGDGLCLIDNITTMLRSAALDTALTGTTYTDRVLGFSEQRTVPIRTVFFASANNAGISSDLVRRALTSRIEPNCEHPEERSGFKHPDIEAHVRAHRGRYLSAALTILRAYAAAGRPRVDTRTMGSFGAWSRTVRDALVWAGAADPVTTQDALRDESDIEREERRELLEAWVEVLGDSPVTVAELLDSVTPAFPTAPKPAVRRLADALRALVSDGKLDPKNVGYRLRQLRGAVYGGRRLVRGGRAHGKVARWRVS